LRATASLNQGQIDMSSIQVKSEKISELTVNRLSIYLRCLNELAGLGVETVSSQSLAERFNLNSAQIRKDLAYFGEFGVRGVGYFIDDLRRHIRSILGLDVPHRLGVIGAGNLGMALANYGGFSASNFHIVALFDNDPSKQGVTEKGIPIHPIERLAEVVTSTNIDIVALAVPPAHAQAAVDAVAAAGVRAVLNFAPVHIAAPEGVKVKTVDLTISLESLSYALARPAQYSADTPHDVDEIAEEHETV
jgi:redox-sensing transcriptional repressor